MKKIFFATLLLLSAFTDFGLVAQPFPILKGLDYNAFTYVPPPDIYTYRTVLNKVQTTTFQIDYESNVPTAARTAINKAIDIWAHLIYSPICTVIVKVKWETLEAGELAHCGPKDYFTISTNPNVYYPVALANSIENTDLDPNYPDIELTIGSTITWYYGIDGNTPANKYDLVTVVLHEVGHGLGYLPSFYINETNQLGGCGLKGTTKPSIYDTYIGYGGISLTTYANPSYALYQALVGHSLGFIGIQSISLNNNEYPHIHAPSPWEDGSSIAHFEEEYYPDNDPNSLMTPYLPKASAIHSPGSVGLAVLHDLGWMINHVITITRPSNESVWIKENIYEIRWTANFSGYANIELHKKMPNGSIQFHSSIYSNHSINSSVNTYYWNIPTSIPNGEYKIVIKNSTDYGESIGFFNITDLNQVVQPEITPPSGVYADEVHVYASCSDPEAVIRYEFGFDPNNFPPDPTENSDILTSTGLISTQLGSFIFKARAFKSGYDPSLVATSIYQIVPGVKIKQLDVSGIAFGQAAYWKQFEWKYVGPVESNLLQYDKNYFLSSQDWKPNTNDKFNYWDELPNNYRRYRNWDTLTVKSTTREVRSHFNQTETNIKIKNNLELLGINGGFIEFKDPWLIDVDEYPYGLRSRGLEAPFLQNTSPFEPVYSSIHKGIFLNQDPSQTPTYYKVGMLLEQPITVNGQERKFFPYKWQNDGGVNFQDEYARQTGAVFTSSDAIATAVLKGQLMSNDQSGINNPSQRKMIRTDNGQYHCVYESMGTVWYTYSLTSNFYGAWSPDEYLHYHGKNPAIDYEDNEVKIVFEYYDPQVGGNATIQLVTYGTSGGGTYEQIDYEEVTTYPNSYYGNAKPVISYSQYEIFVAYRIGPTGVINQKTKWWVSWPSPGWLWGTEAEIPGTNADCINPSATGYYQTANVGYVFIAYENAGTIYFKQARRMPDVHDNPYWDYQTYGEHPVNISALSGFNLNRYPVISLANENSVNQYLMISWQGIYNGTPTNPLPKIDGTKPLYRQAAVVKTGLGTSWGTPSNFSNNVDFTNNGSLNTAYGSIMTWSESNGQYSNYVRRRTPTGYDPITSLTPTNGIHTLVSNGSEFGNIKAMVFEKPTNPPYFLDRCTDDFTYIPDGMGKLSESGVVDISYGRSGIVEKNGIEFVFNIGDVLLNGETIKFIERVDTLPITSIEELNASVRTDTLNLDTQSELIFSDYYYVVNSENADSLVNNDFNVNFKCELVRLSTDEVVGEFEEVNYNKSNLEECGQQGYLIDCSGIEAGEYYLQLTSSVNEEVGLSLSDIQMDNVLLEKSGLNIRNFKGSGIPLEYSLEQNYPNPFNPATTIRYQIPNDGMVTLKVYDILGAEVMSLVNEEQVAGKYEVNFNASGLASGVYIYRLNANEFVNVKKMILLK